MKKYRTQKAQGIAALKYLQGVFSLPHRVVQEEAEIETALEWFANQHDFETLFARPCPERPAHGFVESREVRNKDEALAVWREAIAADPMAEMILMPRVMSACNAIYTGNYLALGPNNDGATGGYNSFGFRCVEGAIPAEIVESASIATDKGEVPYIEVVYGSTNSSDTPKAYVTQIRSGPRTEGSDNYIPKDFHIKVVYCPTDEDKANLLVWKNKVVELAKVDGLVVWDPQATPASHIAVHCVDHQIPFLKSNPNTKDLTMPSKGDFLTAQSIDTDERDPGATRIGLEIGAQIEMDFKDALNLMLFGLHQWQKNRTPAGSKLLGVSAAICTRLSISACLGELRHKRHKNGNDKFFDYNRDVVLQRAWSDVFVSQKMMGAALKSFFEGRWRQGYGGKAWGVCAMRAMELWDACINLYRNPTIDSMVQVSDRLNYATNTIHNGGWQFNKFASKKVMDNAAMSTPQFIINSGASIFRAMTTARPDYSGWSSARKNRSLTEIRKRVDVDKIAQSMAEKAAVKLQGSSGDSDSNPVSPMVSITNKGVEEAYKDQIASWLMEHMGKLPSLIEEKGNITEIHAYAYKMTGDSYKNPLTGSVKLHFQWKTDKMSSHLPYYSMDTFIFNEKVCDKIQELQACVSDPSWATGSGSLYFPLWSVADQMICCEPTDSPDTRILSIPEFWQRYFMGTYC